MARRTIVHADLDAFYASVEQLDNADLRGKPVVVGGSAEGRGVVAAASYEARKFGVRSAMPMSRALRLCPDAVRVSPRFDRYGEVSKQVMDIFRALTPLVEPLSLDEAFLDVSRSVRRLADADAIGRRLKDRVKSRTGLTLSVGIGANKTVAKIASDMRKPDGLVVVRPGHEAKFLAPLAIRTLWGIGPKSEASLVATGIETIGDLARADDELVARLFGSRGPFMQNMARGLDERPVEPEQERKSVGAETTFARDLPDGPELREELRRISQNVAERLARSRVRARTVVLKLRYANFRTITRQVSRPGFTDDPSDIESAAGTLLTVITKPGDMFRLLGVHCSNLEDVASEDEPSGQLSLWSEKTT